MGYNPFAPLEEQKKKTTTRTPSPVEAAEESMRTQQARETVRRRTYAPSPVEAAETSLAGGFMPYGPDTTPPKPPPEPPPPSHGTYQIVSGVVVSDPERYPELIKQYYEPGSVVYFGDRVAVVTKTGQVRFYAASEFEDINWTKAYRMGLVTYEEYQSAKEQMQRYRGSRYGLYAPSPAEAGWEAQFAPPITRYAPGPAEAGMLSSFYQKALPPPSPVTAAEFSYKQTLRGLKFEEMWKTQPTAALEFGLAWKMIPQKTFYEWLPKAREYEAELAQFKLDEKLFKEYYARRLFFAEPPIEFAEPWLKYYARRLYFAETPAEFLPKAPTWKELKPEGISALMYLHTMAPKEILPSTWWKQRPEGMPESAYLHTLASTALSGKELFAHPKQWSKFMYLHTVVPVGVLPSEKVTYTGLILGAEKVKIPLDFRMKEATIFPVEEAYPSPLLKFPKAVFGPLERFAGHPIPVTVAPGLFEVALKPYGPGEAKYYVAREAEWITGPAPSPEMQAFIKEGPVYWAGALTGAWIESYAVGKGLEAAWTGLKWVGKTPFGKEFFREPPDWLKRLFEWAQRKLYRGKVTEVREIDEAFYMVETPEGVFAYKVTRPVTEVKAVPSEYAKWIDEFLKKVEVEKVIAGGKGQYIIAGKDVVTAVEVAIPEESFIPEAITQAAKKGKYLHYIKVGDITERITEFAVTDKGLLKTFARLESIYPYEEGVAFGVKRFGAVEFLGTVDEAYLKSLQAKMFPYVEMLRPAEIAKTPMGVTFRMDAMEKAAREGLLKLTGPSLFKGPVVTTTGAAYEAAVSAGMKALFVPSEAVGAQLGVKAGKALFAFPSWLKAAVEPVVSKTMAGAVLTAGMTALAPKPKPYPPTIRELEEEWLSYAPWGPKAPSPEKAMAPILSAFKAPKFEYGPIPGLRGGAEPRFKGISLPRITELTKLKPRELQAPWVRLKQGQPQLQIPRLDIPQLQTPRLVPPWRPPPPPPPPPPILFDFKWPGELRLPGGGRMWGGWFKRVHPIAEPREVMRALGLAPTRRAKRHVPKRKVTRRNYRGRRK